MFHLCQKVPASVLLSSLFGLSVTLILTTPLEICFLHQLSDRALQFSALHLQLTQAVGQILETVTLSLSSVSTYVLFRFLKYCFYRIFVSNWTVQVGGNTTDQETNANYGNANCIE